MYVGERSQHVALDRNQQPSNLLPAAISDTRRRKINIFSVCIVNVTQRSYVH